MPVSRIVITNLLQTIRHPVVDQTNRITRVWQRQLETLLAAVTTEQTVGGVLSGTHANRSLQSPAALGVSDLWFETDRTVFYIADFTNNRWLYASGFMVGTAASAPTDLGANDAGFQYQCSDSQHIVEWTGTQWVFGPGDPGAAYFADFAVAPTNLGAWHLCDGSATDYLTPGATLTVTPFTTPNLVSGAYRKGGTPYSGALISSGGNATGGGAVDPTHITVLPYFRR